MLVSKGQSLLLQFIVFFHIFLYGCFYPLHRFSPPPLSSVSPPTRNRQYIFSRNELLNHGYLRELAKQQHLSHQRHVESDSLNVIPCDWHELLLLSTYFEIVCLL